MNKPDLDRLLAEYSDPKKYFRRAGERAVWLATLWQDKHIELHRNKKNKNKPNPTLRLYSPRGVELLSIRVRTDAKKSKDSGLETLKLHYENNINCFDSARDKAEFDGILVEANFDINVGSNDHDIADLDEDVGKEAKTIDYDAIPVALGVFSEWSVSGAREQGQSDGDYNEGYKKVLRAIDERRGQHDFRKRLLVAYNGKCAITGCEVEEALEAAHIIPHSEEINYETSRGILLRSDVHTLFDLYLISVDPASGKVVMDEKCKVSYTGIEGVSLSLPANASDHPSASDLMVHYKRWSQGVGDAS
jgi:hypothetical protein